MPVEAASKGNALFLKRCTRKDAISSDPRKNYTALRILAQKKHRFVRDFYPKPSGRLRKRVQTLRSPLCSQV